jgi:hypothetical protein
MTGRVTEGQARLSPIVATVDAIVDGAVDAVDIDALLPAWRALVPACHPGASADVIDVASLADVLTRRPTLLSTGVVDVVDADPRGGDRRTAVARAVADALIVRLEGAKIAHGLPAPAAALRQAFLDPDTARDALAAVRDLEQIAVGPLPALDDDARQRLCEAIAAVALPARPVHVLLGPAVRRVLDLLSPYCRRLRVDLALAGRAPGGIPDDDDVYCGLDRLLAAAPETVAERRMADDAEGFVDGDAGFVVDAALLVEDHVDRRARGLVAPLKGSRAVVVGLVDPGALAALDIAPASLTALARGGDDGVELVVDAATGHALPLPHALRGVEHDGRGASLSVPWRGLTPGVIVHKAAGDGDVRVDEGAFALLQAAWRRRVVDARWPPPRLSFCGQHSAAALAVLAALVPATAERRR